MMKMTIIAAKLIPIAVLASVLGTNAAAQDIYGDIATGIAKQGLTKAEDLIS
jgi:hypothetical protein